MKEMEDRSGHRDRRRRENHNIGTTDRFRNLNFEDENGTDMEEPIQDYDGGGGYYGYSDWMALGSLRAVLWYEKFALGIVRAIMGVFVIVFMMESWLMSRRFSSVLKFFSWIALAGAGEKSHCIYIPCVGCAGCWENDNE